MPVGVELIHETVAGSRDVVVLGIVLHGVGDQHVLVGQRHDPERRVTLRKEPIQEETINLDRLERSVEHIHIAGVEVRRVE